MNYWTPADQAELDTLIWAWVDGYWEHRERCLVCWGGYMCRWAAAALQEIMDWRDKRAATSRAIMLRAQHLAAYRAELA